MLTTEVQKKIDSYIERVSNDIDKTLLIERKNELLKNYQGEDRVISWQKLEQKVISIGEIEKFKTGLESFDKALRGGLERGRLVSMSASSKSGKTSIMIDLMRKLEIYHPCMIMLEQPAEELIREQLYYGNEIPNLFSPKTFNKVTVNWIEERLLESYLKYGTKIAVIDHMDFIEKNNSLRSKHEQIQEVMEELKLMTRRLNMTIFIVAHINKLPPEEKPTYYHLSESSSLYKLSDMTLMLWRECEKINKRIEYSGLTILSIELSRQGGTGENIPLIFNRGNYREASQMEQIEADDRLGTVRIQKKEDVDF